MDNFLSASDLLMQRLRAKLSATGNVLVPERNIRSAPGIEWVIANALDPSVHVIFFDDQPEGVQSKGRIQASQQFWLVAVSVRNVADAVGQAARTDAGLIVLKTLQALQGFDLSPNHGALVRQRCQYRASDKNGFVHFPLLFSTRIIVTGDSR